MIIFLGVPSSFLRVKDAISCVRENPVGILFSRCPCVRPCVLIPPANIVCGGYTVFMLSVRASVCASVRASVLKPCKHVHICKANTLNKKVRARGQFY